MKRLLFVLALALLPISLAYSEPATELRLRAPVTQGGLLVTSISTPSSAPTVALELPSLSLSPNLSLSARQLRSAEGMENEWGFVANYGGLRLQGQQKSEAGVSLAAMLETPLAAFSAQLEGDVWTAEAKGSKASFTATDFGEGMGLSGAVAFAGFTGTYCEYDAKKKMLLDAPDVNLSLDYGTLRLAYLDGAGRPAPEKKALLALGDLTMWAAENVLGPDAKTVREGTQYGLGFSAEKVDIDWRFGITDSLRLRYADGGLKASYLSGDFLWRKEGTAPQAKLDLSYTTQWRGGEVEVSVTRVEQETQAELRGESSF